MNDQPSSTPDPKNRSLGLGPWSFAKPLLEARGLTKKFPGVTALRAVAFDLRPGEIHALCGENGAGKSTLIKLLAGIHPHGSYEGELRVDDHAVAFHSIRDAEAAGIAVITQEFALIAELSVAENIFLGRAPRCGPLGLLLLFDRGPGFGNLVRREIACIPEHMRVTTYQFGGDRLNHASKIKQAFLLGHLRMEDDL